MRTTVDIEDDILAMLREIAQRQNITLGQAISDLARSSSKETSAPKVRNGVRLFTPNTASVESDLHTVNTLRDEE